MNNQQARQEPGSLRPYANLRFILRLVLALLFALPAFIFSEVLPDFKPFNHVFLRIVITIIFGLIGYQVFPDIAKRISGIVIALVNNLVSHLSSEIMSQILRLPRQSNMNLPYTNSGPIGGVSVSQPLIVDTSALIDGRILDIASTGFLYGTLLVPTFVLIELQQVADSSDYLKRSRGRRGFEIIEQLKKQRGTRVEIWDKDVGAKTVDEKLIKLAKGLNGRIITTDYNLNKVATVSGVTVLNFNDLANAVKTQAIPGEELKIKVIHLGKDTKQGVGYLNDGTMVVVENGANLVGQEVKTEVSRVLQVPAGKMIFTKAK